MDPSLCDGLTQTCADSELDAAVRLLSRWPFRAYIAVKRKEIEHGEATCAGRARILMRDGDCWRLTGVRASPVRVVDKSDVLPPFGKPVIRHLSNEDMAAFEASRPSRKEIETDCWED